MADYHDRPIDDVCRRGEFRNLSNAAKIDFINRLWNVISIPYRFDTLAQRMYTPTNRAPAGSEPLPSSWCPAARNPTTFHMRTANTGVPDPWMAYSVGFRVDGQNEGSVERVIGNGMTQQILNEAFMLHHRANGYAVLWAVDCRGLVGFDTEAVQLALPGAAQWRPGEKAFQEIEPERLIGCVKIRKMGSSAAGGWTFSIEEDANWRFLSGGTVDQVGYVNDELHAWRGRIHHIPGEFDFA